MRLTWAQKVFDLGPKCLTWAQKLALLACLLLVPSWDGGGTVATILILEAFGYGVADWLAGDVH